MTPGDHRFRRVSRGRAGSPAAPARRLAGALAAVVVAVAVALAAGGLATAGALASAAFAAAATPSKAQAKAFARAVNLRTGDIPGFKTGSVSTTTPSDAKTGAEVASCAGGVDPSRAIYDSDSPDFTQTSGIVHQDISSEVEILPSDGLVAKDLAAVKSTKGKRCLEHYFSQELAAEKIPGVSFGSISLETMKLPAAGASGSFALRFNIPAKISGTTIPYYFDFLGFTLGRAEVTLSALGFAAAVPDTDEQGLFSLLLRRAEAASARL
jgi:hypothetical protein